MRTLDVQNNKTNRTEFAGMRATFQCYIHVVSLGGWLCGWSSVSNDPQDDDDDDDRRCRRLRLAAAAAANLRLTNMRASAV